MSLTLWSPLFQMLKAIMMTFKDLLTINIFFTKLLEYLITMRTRFNNKKRVQW